MTDPVRDVASSNAMELNDSDGDGDDDDDDGEPLSSKSKSVHSLVEKKRRFKMTQYVAELSSMIPMCGAMQRKLDKITVLRMAVQHLKAIKGSKVASPKGPDEKFCHLANETAMKAVLDNGDVFLFVVACDRGKFLYASESVINVLHCSHIELIGQSIFDVLHSKDVAKVKEQLIAYDTTAREIFIDAKTMAPINPDAVPKEEIAVTSPGAARSFFCRMKCHPQAPALLKTEPEDPDTTKKKRVATHLYVNLQCNGFLKAWSSSKVTSDTQETENTTSREATSSLACLVSIARTVRRLQQSDLDRQSHAEIKSIRFYARLNNEYKFSYVEPMITYLTGFLPQEILGNLVFEYFIEEDLLQLKELLKMATKAREKLVSPVLTLRTADQATICVRIVLSTFKNPVTGDLEQTVLDITAVSSQTKTSTCFTVVPSSFCVEQADTSSPHTPSRSESHPSHSLNGEDDAKDEADMALIMGFMEAEGGLGGQVESQHVDWALF